jgi:type I restriction enzyme S subunit
MARDIARFVRLEEVAHAEMGQSPPSEVVTDRQDAGIPFLQGNAEFTATHPVAKLWCHQPQKVCISGDVLISVRAPVGAINVADQDYCIGRGLAAVRFTGAEQGYGFHALKHHSPNLRRLAQGTTFEAIGRRELGALHLWLPPDVEQQRIAQILDTLDQAIGRTEQIIAKLKQIKQGLLHDLLTRGIDDNGEPRDPERRPEQFKDSPLGPIPREWNIVELARAINIVDCKHFTPRYVSEGYPVIRPRNVKIDGLDLSDVEYVSEADFRLLTDVHEPRKNDIIFSRNASFGIPCYFDGDYRFAIGQDVVVMTENPAADTRYIFFALQAEKIEGQIRRNSGGSTFGRINLGEIRRLMLALPVRQEQARIADLLYALKQRQAHEETSVSKLRLLKLGLMEDLLTGRVRVTNLEIAA